MSAVEVDGVAIVNATLHELRFRAASGEIVAVPPSGYTLPTEKSTSVARTASPGLPELVATKYAATKAGRREIADAYARYGGKVVIVGSVVSAHAYPGQVVRPVPVPGREGAAPQDEIYRADQFAVFI